MRLSLKKACRELCWKVVVSRPHLELDGACLQVIRGALLHVNLEMPFFRLLQNPRLCQSGQPVKYSCWVFTKGEVKSKSMRSLSFRFSCGSCKTNFCSPRSWSQWMRQCVASLLSLTRWRFGDLAFQR